MMRFMPSLQMKMVLFGLVQKTPDWTDLILLKTSLNIINTTLMTPIQYPLVITRISILTLQGFFGLPLLEED